MSSTLVAKFFPELTSETLCADLDSTHVAHGSLDRLPELDFMRAQGGVEGWLHYMARCGRRDFTVKNVDWTHPAARKPLGGFLSFGADVDTALRFLHRGATVTAEFINRQITEFQPIWQRLARELGHPADEQYCRVDMLAGPPGLCTEMHTDADYAINLQIFGGKNWRVMANSLSHPPDGCNDEDTPLDVIRVSPGYRVPIRMTDVAATFATQPGTAVWRQTGVWHETDNTGDDLNLSLVFTLCGRGRHRDFTARLVDFLHRQPGWRAPMFGASADPARQKRYRERIASMLIETFHGQSGACALDALYNLPVEIGSRYRFRCANGALTRRMVEGDQPVLAVETNETVGVIELKGDVEALADLGAWLVDQKGAFTGADAVGYTRVSDVASRLHVEDVARLLLGLCQLGAVVRKPVAAHHAPTPEGSLSR